MDNKGCRDCLDDSISSSQEPVLDTSCARRINLCKDCNPKVDGLRDHTSIKSYKPPFRSLSSISTYLSLTSKTNKQNDVNKLPQSKSFTATSTKTVSPQSNTSRKSTNRMPCCSNATSRAYTAATVSTTTTTNNICTTSRTGLKLTDKRSKYNMIKRPTFSILRDVKNSVAQRWRQAREDSRFERLDNDPSCMTPKVELYSPFNVSYAESPSNMIKGGEFGDTPCRKRSSNQSASSLAKDGMVSLNDDSNDYERRPRVKLMFDSPSGKLQQSVSEIERLQRDFLLINDRISARQTTAGDVSK